MTKRRNLDYLAGNNIEENAEEVVKTKSNLERFAEEDAKEVDSKKEEVKDKKEDNNNEKHPKIAKKFSKVIAKKDEKKVKTMIYLDKDVMDQFKTLSMILKKDDEMENMSVTKLMASACAEYIRGQEIDEDLVREYDEINQKKGNRK